MRVLILLVSMLLVLFISGCSNPVDCNDDFDCFVNSLKECSQATFKVNFNENSISSLTLKVTIENRQGNQCFTHVYVEGIKGDVIENTCSFEMGSNPNSSNSLLIYSTDCLDKKISEEKRQEKAKQLEGSVTTLEVTTNPEKYLNKTIKVKGDLSEIDPFFSHSPYPELGFKYEILDYDRMNEFVEKGMPATNHYLLLGLAEGHNNDSVYFYDTPFTGVLRRLDLDVCNCEVYGFIPILDKDGYYNETRLVDSCKPKDLNDSHPRSCLENSKTKEVLYYLELPRLNVR